MNTSLAIHTQDLKKSYGRIQALRGVDLEVRQGEIYGFLGPNGAGKTTTIRCMLDLIRPNGGVIRILGLDPQKDPVAVRQRVGYLPGELHLYDNLTSEKALRFLGALRGGQIDWQHIRQLSDRLELDLKRPIKNLSRGNKLKVGVIQALMHRPELLLLDEPTTGLDPLMQQEALRMVKEAREAGATVFFSSHNIKEVETTADRAAIISQGVVVEVVEIAELLTRALRRVRVHFREPVTLDAILALPDVTLLRQNNKRSVLLQIVGDMDRLLKRLADYPIIDLETERPSLEEIFMAFYASGDQERSR